MKIKRCARGVYKAFPKYIRHAFSYVMHRVVFICVISIVPMHMFIVFNMEILLFIKAICSCSKTTLQFEL